MTNEALTNRIAELEAEHQKGVARLASLDAMKKDAEAQVFRIEGAIQMCREMRDKAETDETMKKVESQPAKTPAHGPGTAAAEEAKKRN